MDQPISGDKIVYIDIDTLLNKYELYLDKKAALEEQSKAAEKSLSGKIEAFQRKMAKFQQEIANIQQNAASYAPVELKKLEEKYAQQQMNLAKEEESLMKQRDNAAMDLESKLQETQKDLQNKIDEYLEKVAETKGYDYVLMKGVGGSVMFGRKALDITQETLR
ncbi:MAG: OmpH family outer membrane protein [Chitinophagales bacterium]|nr:OmpH family outer membrane protein [Chitinophagales bacterium]